MEKTDIFTAVNFTKSQRYLLGVFQQNFAKVNEEDFGKKNANRINTKCLQ